MRLDILDLGIITQEKKDGKIWLMSALKLIVKKLSRTENPF